MISVKGMALNRTGLNISGRCLTFKVDFFTDPRSKHVNKEPGHRYTLK